MAVALHRVKKGFLKPLPSKEAVALAIRNNVPMSKILAASHNETQAKYLRNLALDVIEDTAFADTPYGQVCRSFKIGDAQDVDVHYADPAALLHQVSQRSPYFGGFVVKCVNRDTGRIILYIDSTTPGNQNRPDHGRSYDGIYWTIAQFPGWFRTQGGIGWIPFAFVPKVDLEKAGCSQAVLMDKVMRLFWNPVEGEFNLERAGVRINAQGHSKSPNLQISKSPNLQISNSQNLKLSKSQNLKISKYKNLKISNF